jgi:aryl-alcohol dehydrogenase (NADP+)
MLENMTFTFRTPLALGGNVFGWTADEMTSFQILDEFTGGGGDLIDTSDSYSAGAPGKPGNKGGESETIIGRWLEQTRTRDDVVIVTKVSRHPEFRGLGADTVRAAAQASLRRLRTDRIDLYFAHFDDPDVPLADTLGAFDQLITDGTILNYGLSNYTPERLEEALRIVQGNGLKPPVALQPQYNLLEREPFESRYAPIAARENLAVLTYWSLASGFLSGKYTRESDLTGARGKSASKYFTDRGFAVVAALRQVAHETGAPVPSVALAWLAAQPSVSAPIASASTPDQVGPLLLATQLQLTPEQMAMLTTVSQA